MNIALIFAGGTGRRMNSKSKPKQFMELYGKPIILYTIDNFEESELIDAIVVVCLSEWIDKLKTQINKFGIKKVIDIIPGGVTGQESIHRGLERIAKFAAEDDIILIHDGVRPFLDEKLIENNIILTKEKGCAISIASVTESVVEVSCEQKIQSVPVRQSMYAAKAPQTFYLKNILEGYRRAENDNFVAVDSAHLMNHYGYELFTTPTSMYNIKITSPTDYYIFRALFEAIENEQIQGLEIN